MIPLIGITSREFTGIALPALGTYRPYVDAVIAAGGAPVIVPLGAEPERWAAVVAERLDGVLFTGGEDIEPERYGAARHPKLGDVSAERDGVELSLYRAAKRAGVPVLGICRGLQLINVAHGGTLYQDLAAEYPGVDTVHRGRTGWTERTERVEVTPGSRLRALVGGGEIDVNSLHHQAVRDLGAGLVVTARCATDGVIEAFEGTGPEWLVAVQWHPETVCDGADGVRARAIFKAFVEAATVYRNGRAAGAGALVG